MKLKLPDIWLFLPALLLSILGLIITFSIANAEFVSQLTFFLVGVVLFIAFSLVDFSFLTAFSLPLLALSTLLLLVTTIFAQSVRGSRRWLVLGNLNVQTSELVKPFLILGLSYIGSRLNMKNFSNFLILLGILGVVALMIFLQPDLGSMGIILLTGFFLILGSYPKKRFIVAIVLLTVILVPLIWSSLAPYQQQRIHTFLNPQADPLGASYNQIQAVIAAGSGQFLGKGLGKGSQSRLQFLPEKHTDFFYASLAEELGFLGSFLVVVLVFGLCARLLILFTQSNDNMKRMLFLGSFALFFFQSIFHMGINLGLFPVTGITLPFLSVGGSSMLASWMVLGIASSASLDIKKDKSILLK